MYQYFLLIYFHKNEYNMYLILVPISISPLISKWTNAQNTPNSTSNICDITKSKNLSKLQMLSKSVSMG